MNTGLDMPLSPAAAAKVAGVSRSLISREIKAGNLKATLKNNGHRSIGEDDLDEWIGRRTERAQVEPEKTVETTTAPQDNDRIKVLEDELATTRTSLARLEGRAEATEARLSDLAADRDAWRAQAERLASEARPSIFGRLFGR